MTTAREIMHRGVQSIIESESVMDAAQRIRLCGMGALPVCDTDLPEQATGRFVEAVSRPRLGLIAT